MANRLTKIYTRTGDDGSTGLGDGSRIAKDDPRINALGTVDELNSSIGLLLAESLPGPVARRLECVQNDLFDLGAELSLPGEQRLQSAQVARLEQWLDEFNASLAPLVEFILPGGCRGAAACHVARTVCRRAERILTTLLRAGKIERISVQYLNRLSDLLFVLCRIINREHGVADVYWTPAQRE